jgi:DNA-binding MltR family transcriptional regulator
MQPGDGPTLPVPDPRAQLKENQKNLRQDADHLLQLAKELKDEAEKTEQTDVLSLSLVKKAEEVEKLARHIKDLARAS